MGALKRTHDGTVNATCTGGCARPLDWTVQTEEHAVNVLNKHNREYHPDEPPFTVHAAVVDFQPECLAPETAVAVPEVIPDGVPPVLNLTAAAAAYLRALDSSYALEAAGACDVFEALLGAGDVDLREIAVALTAGTPVHAYTVPF